MIEFSIKTILMDAIVVHHHDPLQDLVWILDAKFAVTKDELQIDWLVAEGPTVHIWLGYI